MGSGAFQRTAARTIATLSVAIAFGLHTAVTVAAEPRIEDSLKRCATYVDDSSRLTCFDKLTAVVSREPVASTVTVAGGRTSDTPGIAAIPLTKTESGRHNVDERPEPERDDVDARADDSTTYNLIGMYQDRRKRWYFELGNGQVWRQTEAAFWPAVEQFPVRVSISKGIFGSRDLRAESFTGSVKVKRHK